MSSLPDKDSTEHVPVLVDMLLDLLDVSAPKLIIDGTLGAGGHAKALLAKFPESTLIGIDKDPYALELARSHLKQFEDRLQLVQASSSDFGKIMDEAGETYADILLFDIGVSSMQVDTPQRGFSYHNDGPLDMRFSMSGETALELIDRLGEKELADVIYNYGEERYSRRIAREIKVARKEGGLERTTELADICRRCYPRRRFRLDPAAKTFQALRISVNDELGELERILGQVPARLAPGGRVAVISFHSLEDRIVKHRFLAWKQEKLAKIVTKKPVIADQKELGDNPRSRSAKLRICEWNRD